MNRLVAKVFRQGKEIWAEVKIGKNIITESALTEKLLEERLIREIKKTEKYLNKTVTIIFDKTDFS